MLVLAAAIGMAAGWATGCKPDAQQTADESEKAHAASEEAGARIRTLAGAHTMTCEALESPNDVYVDLREVKSVDAALKAIAHYPQVGWIVLKQTDLTEAGMKHMSAFPQLQILDVSGTKITDASLKNHKGLTHLRYVWLDGTKVTAAGVAELQKALPKCSITH
jgi:hypothetical protein